MQYRFWNNKFYQGIMGMLTQKEKDKPASYSRMKQKQIEKRRVRNKIARKSRRINRLRMA